MSGDWLSSFLFPALALPIVVPSAFFFGVIGCRLSPSSSTLTGLIIDGIGVIATAVVSFLLVGGVLTAGAVFSLSSVALLEAAEILIGRLAVSCN
ncbi:hypothetical protein [Halobellus captivus]|uniref:hypothetical protein n=1 Tax=Halobellus captivus TaxID=2592614 RepID=UPI00193AC220|nr:hypothetical protein [Halobellus captivus]